MKLKVFYAEMKSKLNISFIYDWLGIVIFWIIILNRLIDILL